MKEDNLKWVIKELENARSQGDGTIRVDMGWKGYPGTMNYLDFRTFCDELIREIRTR